MRALRRSVRELGWGLAEGTREGIPMGADPACLKGRGACSKGEIV